MSNLDHSTSLVEAFNAGDWTRFQELAGDVVYIEPGTGRSLQGDEYLQAVQAWKIAFPDLTGDVTRAFAAGDDVAMQIAWTGTHDGPMMMPTGEQVPATGNPVEVHGAIVSSYDGDVLRTTTHYFDLLTILRAIGAA